jgi:hypothetical protein
MEIKDVFEYISEYLMNILLENFYKKKLQLVRHALGASLASMAGLKSVSTPKKKTRRLYLKLSYIMLPKKLKKKKLKFKTRKIQKALKLLKLLKKRKTRKIRKPRLKLIMRRIFKRRGKWKKKVQTAIAYPLLLQTLCF